MHLVTALLGLYVLVSVPLLWMKVEENNTLRRIIDSLDAELKELRKVKLGFNHKTA
jgi:hypothetical protein